MLDHGLNEPSHLAVADSPDLNDFELNNRQMVEELELLADAVNDAIGLVSATIRTLFSLNGLAALRSYALLQIILQFRFYGL